MEPMRWNNADPNPGARPQTSVFRGDKGLDVANQNRASGGGRKMFLTTPFIDQAFYTSDRRDLCRVNFEVNNLKPFPHLAFPHFLAQENTLKQPSFDGELMARCLVNYCGITWL